MDIATVLVSAGVGAIAGIATQSFGAWISGRYWIAQEKWKLRGDSYRRLFDALAELEALYKWIEALQGNQKPDVIEARLKQQENLLVRFQSARALARGFVGKEAMQAVDRLDAELRRLRTLPEPLDAAAAARDALSVIEETLRKLSHAARTDFDS